MDGVKINTLNAYNATMTWQALWTSGFWMQIAAQWHAFKPLFLGSSILSIVAAVFSYIAALHLIKMRRARQESR